MESVIISTIKFNDDHVFYRSLKKGRVDQSHKGWYYNTSNLIYMTEYFIESELNYLWCFCKRGNGCFRILQIENLAVSVIGLIHAMQRGVCIQHMLTRL
ncbi:hypothetical protein SDC9_140681 [bioreactor metagenome]|uniref:Uncharacterized protein n=1 Tax=bioreactor metagenome TaxID=1076179 RepID=A0A645DYY1_9ZZZZ